MATSTDISNRALTLLGATRISSLTDGSKNARDVGSQYDLSRLSELRSNRWGFSMKQAALPADAVAPLFAYTYAYTLPSDFVRLDWLADQFVGLVVGGYIGKSVAEYSIQGRKLLTNFKAPLNIRYGYDVQDATQFDSLFGDALAHQLALDCCLAVTGSITAKQALYADYKLVIAAAISTNAIERPPEPFADDSWISSRL